MNGTAFSLTPTEQAIAALLEEGYTESEVRRVCGSYHSIYATRDKLRCEREFQKSLNQCGARTPLKTAHGRKMKDFIR